MKQIVTTTILALAGVSLVSHNASADLTHFTQGDLLLGFNQNGTTSDLVVDLGPASAFINASTAFNVTFGLIPTGQPGPGTVVTSLSSDLNAIFGSNWASNSQSNLVQWGIVGSTDRFTNGATFGLPKNTLFLTEAETTPGVQSTPLQRFKGSVSGTIGATLSSFENTGTPSFNNSATTNFSTFATSQPIGQANSWVSFNPDSTGFGTGFDLEQAPAGSFNGPTNSVLDLYELQPNTVNGGDGTYLGSFSLSSGGALTYSPAPEPSSLGLMGFATTLLGMARFRRRPAKH